MCKEAHINTHVHIQHALAYAHVREHTHYAYAHTHNYAYTHTHTGAHGEKAGLWSSYVKITGDIADMLLEISHLNLPFKTAIADGIKDFLNMFFSARCT